MTLPDFLTEHTYGEIRLTGHRIGLEHVLQFYKEGFSPEMVHGQYPSVPLALIHKVIAFYLENQAEVDAYVTHCAVEIERQRATAAKGPSLSELQQRIKDRRAAEKY